MIGREDEIRDYRRKISYYFIFMCCAWVLIVSRLVFLQIYKGEELAKFSEANRLKKEKVFPTRGTFYDRDGKVLVDNRAAFDVMLLNQYYKQTPETDHRLARALKITDEELDRRLAKINKTPSYVPVLLKADVNKDVIAAIETDREGFPGVDVEDSVQRRYPFGDTAAQLFGYTSEVDTKDIQNDKAKNLQQGDYIGRMGLERYYDPYLRGINGVGYVEVDAMGRRRKTEGAEKLLGFVSQTDPVAGNDLHLTIDADLQAAADKALSSRNFNGSVIALDPRSGEILALVNRPAFLPEKISSREIDPKHWKELRDNKDRPLRNRSIQDIYPPGSTFKLFVAIAALAEKKVTLNSAINCTGGLQFGNRRFSCWKHHGYTDFMKSIRESCDVFYYGISNQLGVDTIAHYSRLFGLGQVTEIKLFGEHPGYIPDTEWKRRRYNDIWHPGETLSVSIGQGYVNVTPLQLVNAYAAIGTSGFLYRPYVVRSIEKPNGEVLKEFHPELIRKIDLPTEVFDAVKQGLFEVANKPGGTAIISGHSKKTVMSGKTGTAQVRAFGNIMGVKCENLPNKDRHHGWFVGYAPRDNPEIAVVALAEHACHGSSAAPIVRDVIDTYIDKKYPQPTAEELKKKEAKKEMVGHGAGGDADE